MSDAELEKLVEELTAKVAKLEAERGPPSGPRPHGPTYDPTANMRMPDSAVAEMSRVVGNVEIAQIAKDHVGRPTTLPGARVEQVKRGWGWVDPPKLGPPSGIDLCDRMMDQQDAIDKAELERRLGRKP